MVKRSTWLILAIFVLMLAASLIYNQLSKEKGDENPLADIAELSELEAVEPVFPIPQGEIVVGIQVDNQDGDRVEVRRLDPEEDWLLVEPSGEGDQDTISRIVTQVQNLKIQQSLDEDVSLDILGLDTPSYRVHLNVSNGGVFTLFIGDVTITNTSYYVQLAGENPIVVNKFSIDPIISWLSKPPIQIQATSTPVP